MIYAMIYVYHFCPLTFLFQEIFLGFYDPIYPAIALEVEIKFVIITRERTHIGVNVKTNIARSHHKSEYSI
jgi:hypothetical protein